MNSVDARIEVLPQATTDLYDEIFQSVDDPEVLEGWLRERSVHCEIIINEEMSFTDMMEIGAAAQKFAHERRLSIFRTEGDGQACVLFWARSADELHRALVEVQGEELVVHQVMTS